MGKTTKSENVYRDDVIILRSVYDKVSSMKYYIQPCRDPKTGLFPPCVKKVNPSGEMIMSERERNDYAEGRAVFFPEDHMFIVMSGKKYDLTNPYDKAEWECIKNCKLIARSRDARDSKGNFIIDGVKPKSNNPGRNGIAELYIDRPGLDAARRVSRKQLQHKAMSYIYEDERGAEGQRNMALILGKDMFNQNINDVIDFLIRTAEKDPEKIISLYTGGDTTTRILFINAKKKYVITLKKGIYYFGDVILGSTDDAVVAWMKDPKNKKLVEQIEKDTYPDYSVTESAE